MIYLLYSAFAWDARRAGKDLGTAQFEDTGDEKITVTLRLPPWVAEMLPNLCHLGKGGKDSAFVQFVFGKIFIHGVMTMANSRVDDIRKISDLIRSLEVYATEKNADG